MKTQKLDLLLGIYIAAIVASELMGSKTFSLFGLNASVAIFIFPLTYTINDIVAEVYGKPRARSFVRVAGIILLMLFGYSLLATSLPPTTRFADSNEAYSLIFGKSQRMIVASLVAFWVSEQFDVFVFSKIKQKLANTGLWFRNNFSNTASQFLDTVLFMFLAFYSGDNFVFVWSLVIPYWLLKVGFSVVHTPFTYAGVKWLKTNL